MATGFERWAGLGPAWRIDGWHCTCASTTCGGPFERDSSQREEAIGETAPAAELFGSDLQRCEPSFILPSITCSCTGVCPLPFLSGMLTCTVINPILRDIFSHTFRVACRSEHRQLSSVPSAEIPVPPIIFVCGLAICSRHCHVSLWHASVS